MRHVLIMRKHPRGNIRLKGALESVVEVLGDLEKRLVSGHNEPLGRDSYFIGQRNQRVENVGDTAPDGGRVNMQHGEGSVASVKRLLNLARQRAQAPDCFLANDGLEAPKIERRWLTDEWLYHMSAHAWVVLSQYLCQWV